MKILNVVVVNFFLILLLTQSVTLLGQNKIKKGQKTITVLSGFLNPEPFTFSIFTFSDAGNPTPSFNINYNYAVSNSITVGPFGSFYRVNADFSNTVDQYALLLDSEDFNQLVNGLNCIVLGNCPLAIVTERISVYTLGINGTITRNIVKQFETYLSMHLGYSLHQRESIVDNILQGEQDRLDLGIEVPSFVYFTSVGIRRYITDRIALNGEFGFGNSHLLTIGLMYNLGY